MGFNWRDVKHALISSSNGNYNNTFYVQKEAKMKIWIYIMLLALGVLLGYFLFSSSPTTTTVTTTITDTIYQDTGSYNVHIEHKNHHHYVHTTDTFWKTEYIDSSMIINDWHATRLYDSTAVDDSSVYIHYSGIVTRNRLMTLDLKWKNKRATVINNSTNTTTTIMPPRFYVGGMAGGNSESFDYGVSVGYQKDRMFYQGQYMIGTKSVYVGVSLGL